MRYKWYNPNGVMFIVGDVAGGVGGMLPTVAIMFGTGGSGAGSLALGLGVAGQSVSEAAKQSGTAGGKEWLYYIEKMSKLKYEIELAKKVKAM